MKTKSALKLILGLSVISSSFVGAFANDSVLNSDPIDINGYVSEAPVSDNELEKVRGELRRQKQTIQINKEKSKKYKELGRTTEKLADVTESMIEERSEATSTIDRYNKKIDVFIESTSKFIPEYLVSYELLVEKCKTYKLELVESELFSEYFNKIKSEIPDDDSDKEAIHKIVMELDKDPVQKKFSFFNRWCIFKKV